MRNGKYAARRTSGAKVFALLLALVLVMGCAIGGTLAWLSATSETVTNTFTVGDINITLEEHKLLDNGTLSTTETVQKNENYKIVPGNTQPKDPFVTVGETSEKCYVYVKIENTMKIGNNVVVTPDISSSDWENLGSNGDVTLYRYKSVVDASTADVVLKVFNNITYSGTEITKDNIDSLKTGKIELKAYAHQSENVDQDVADDAAKAWAGITTDIT